MAPGRGPARSGLKGLGRPRILRSSPQSQARRRADRSLPRRIAPGGGPSPHGSPRDRPLDRGGDFKYWIWTKKPYLGRKRPSRSLPLFRHPRRPASETDRGGPLEILRGPDAEGKSGRILPGDHGSGGDGLHTQTSPVRGLSGRPILRGISTRHSGEPSSIQKEKGGAPFPTRGRDAPAPR